MNDTTLQAYALEKGINKSTQEMTNQEKIGLAMDMFMEKTAYAAGNYAKENETLAGSLGTAKAALTNFLDGSGDVNGLVTSFSNFANVIVRQLGELAPRLVTGLTDVINQIMPKLPPLLQKLLPVIVSGAVSLISGVVAVLPSILDVLITSAIPQLLSGAIQIFNALISALPSLVQSICSALPSLIPLLINGVVSMVVTLCSNFSQIIQPIIDILPDLIVILVTTLLENLPVLLAGIGQLVMGIIRAIPQLLSGLWQSITTLASKATSKLFGSIEGWIRKLFPKSADTIFKILGTIKDAFVTWINNLKAIFSVVVSVISTPFKLAWNGIKFVWNNVVAYFKLIWNNIKAIFSVVDSVLSGDFKGAWNGIKKIWSNCVQFFKDIISNVKKAFSNVGEILAAPFRKGKDAVKKIVDNIKGFFSGLKLKFPNIKLPHFSIKPSGWKIGDLLKGSIPKLGIEWYAKAMNNPMLLQDPTVFGYNPATGNLKAGGEAGDEIVGGANPIMNMIRSAVASENGALAYYLQQLLALLADYFPQVIEAAGHDIVTNDGVIVAHYTPKINKELGKISVKKGRGR